MQVLFPGFQKPGVPRFGQTPIPRTKVQTDSLMQILPQVLICKKAPNKSEKPPEPDSVSGWEIRDSYTLVSVWTGVGGVGNERSQQKRFHEERPGGRKAWTI